jgi:hypothetical protein
MVGIGMILCWTANGLHSVLYTTEPLAVSCYAAQYYGPHLAGLDVITLN